MVNIWLFTGCHTCQVVIVGFLPSIVWWDTLTKFRNGSMICKMFTLPIRCRQHLTVELQIIQRRVSAKKHGVGELQESCESLASASYHSQGQIRPGVIVLSAGDICGVSRRCMDKMVPIKKTRKDVARMHLWKRFHLIRLTYSHHEMIIFP